MREAEAEQIRKKLLEKIGALEIKESEKEILKKQIKQMSKEQLEELGLHLELAARTQKCLFCEISAGKIETIKIYEDKEIIAILDIYPASLGHMIIMPKAHFETITEIPDPLLAKLFLFIKEIMPTFLKITNAKGVNIFIAQGELAGQSVKHFAINLIPRYERDGILFGWEKLKVTKEKLEALAEHLRKEAAKEISAKTKKEETETEKIMKHVKKRLP